MDKWTKLKNGQKIGQIKKRGSVFDHIMDTFGSSGELDVNRPVFWAYMPFLDALSNFRP